MAKPSKTFCVSRVPAISATESQGAAALALQHRAVDVLRAGLAEDIELRQVSGEGLADPLLRRLGLAHPGENLRVAGQQPGELAVQRLREPGAAQGEDEQASDGTDEETLHEAPAARYAEAHWPFQGCLYTQKGRFRRPMCRPGRQRGL
ncbi:MAG: hypothetical protein U1E35_04770 [Rhodospirillales bacterium]